MKLIIFLKILIINSLEPALDKDGYKASVVIP